jgi:hypothetical protein
MLHWQLLAVSNTRQKTVSVLVSLCNSENSKRNPTQRIKGKFITKLFSLQILGGEVVHG